MHLLYRSSHQRCSVRKGVLRNFTKFTGKHLYQSYYFNKVAGIRPATLLKKTLWHRFFTVNFAKFLKTPFLQNSSGRLLLYVTKNSGTSTSHHQLLTGLENLTLSVCLLLSARANKMIPAWHFMKINRYLCLYNEKRPSLSKIWPDI